MDHFFDAGGGSLRPRAVFDDEPAANRAVNRVHRAVGRPTHGHYRCRYPNCGAWHIRMLPADRQALGRPA